MSKGSDRPQELADQELNNADGGLVINLSVAVKDDTPGTGSQASASPHRFDPYKNFKFR